MGISAQGARCGLSCNTSQHVTNRLHKYKQCIDTKTETERQLIKRPGGLREAFTIKRFWVASCGESPKIGAWQGKGPGSYQLPVPSWKLPTSGLFVVAAIASSFFGQRFCKCAVGIECLSLSRNPVSTAREDKRLLD